ncbi:MAG TPA: hypothetical protein VGO47_02930 [Chlamydiales bacterium]|nr:hypothetical protein [Chlamydiales bacterium]
MDILFNVFLVSVKLSYYGSNNSGSPCQYLDIVVEPTYPKHEYVIIYCSTSENVNRIIVYDTCLQMPLGVRFLERESTFLPCLVPISHLNSLSYAVAYGGANGSIDLKNIWVGSHAGTLQHGGMLLVAIFLAPFNLSCVFS